MLAICVWRAKFQSFTVDEAFVYLLFVNQKFANMAKIYDAGNHILQTLMMRAAAHYFGTSELALRVPSLLGALLCCLATLKLTEFLLAGWSRLLVVALIVLNPLMLDFFVAARGYGLGIGLLLWALYCALRYLTQAADLRWLRWSAVMAGLAVAANLTLLVPCAALGAMILVLALREGKQAAWRVIDSFAVPALVVAFIFVGVPLLRATPKNFYYGTPSVLISVNSLVASVVKDAAYWPGPLKPELSAAGAGLFLMALTAGFVRVIPACFRTVPLPYRLHSFALLAGTLLLSVAAIVFQHVVLSAPWPLDRTALYLVPLSFLSAACGLRLQPWPKFRYAAAAAGLIVAGICVWQSEFRTFGRWRFDASTNRLMRTLETDFHRRDWREPRPVDVGTDPLMKQSANYYHQRYRLEWMEPPDSSNLESKPYDYYLLTHEQRRLVGTLNLETLEVDPLSNSILAKRRP